MKELAIVIGAGGMGQAVARKLAERYRVLIADINYDQAVSAATSMTNEGASVSAIQCDVTSRESVNALADKVAEEGGFKALVHVAGLSPTMGDFDQIVRVNLVGPALVSNALLPHAQQGAAAILIASLGAHLCTVEAEVSSVLRDFAASDELPDQLRRLLGNDRADANAAYQLSKFGLLMLCRRSAREWGHQGARIMSLSPGIIATPMGAREFDGNPAKRRLFEMSPQKREGTLDEISEVIDFLVSARASFISGTDILVDGGLAGSATDIPFPGVHSA